MEQNTFQITLTGKEIILLMDALNDTLNSLEYYIEEGNDQVNIDADRAVFTEYLYILSKLKYPNPPKTKTVINIPENQYVDNPEFLEIA